MYCEGEKTEPEYLTALKREPTVKDVASVDIQIADDPLGAVPMTLVAAAVDKKSRLPDEYGEIDEVWCIFDVEWPENHPNLEKAVDLANRNGIRLAISNPCFELWLALHFWEHTAWLDTKTATKLRRNHDMSSGKGLNGEVYMPRRADAARRARHLSEKHEQDGTDFPNDNPSSGMFRFLNAIEPGT